MGPKRRRVPTTRWLGLGLAVALVPACSGGRSTAGMGEARTPAKLEVNRSLCDPSGKTKKVLDLNHDGRPDIVDLYVGGRLSCRKSDLNFDGRMDVTTYFVGGQIVLEEMDLDFDGKIDLEAQRRNGKIVRQDLDTNYDGRPDMWEYFSGGHVVRIERDTNGDGHVDTWEDRSNPKLIKIGRDTNDDGRPDQWDTLKPTAADSEADAVPADSGKAAAATEPNE